MKNELRNIVSFLLITITLPAFGDELRVEKDTILGRDSRNEAVDFSLQSNGSNLNFFVIDVTGEASAMDVFRVFLHTADHFKKHKFGKVKLGFRGEVRFVLDGSHFEIIGQEFETQNPMYTVRTFPEKLFLPNGQSAYEHHSGGILYLTRVQMRDFHDMNAAWYMNDLLAEQKAKIDALRPKEFASDDEVF